MDAKHDAAREAGVKLLRLTQGPMDMDTEVKVEIPKAASCADSRLHHLAGTAASADSAAGESWQLAGLMALLQRRTGSTWTWRTSVEQGLHPEQGGGKSGPS